MKDTISIVRVIEFELGSRRFDSHTKLLCVNIKIESYIDVFGSERAIYCSCSYDTECLILYNIHKVMRPRS